MIRAGPREGLLRLDKPAGPTSHDMVALARRELGVDRVGHSGTLDPFASGLLLLCLGTSTRLVEYLSSLPKEYLGLARLGVQTDTDDPEGEVLSASEDWRALDEGRVREALASFEGESCQTPPAYSAKKVGGERAYRRARRGEDVDVPPVPVTVHSIALERLDLPFVEFRAVCSTGTYVRAIARDLGNRLGGGAHLTALRRVAIGPFGMEGAVSPDGLRDPDALTTAWVPPLAAVGHLPRIDLESDDARARLEHGQALPVEELEVPPVDPDEEVAVAIGGRLVAIAVRDGDRIRPRKVFPLG